MATTKLIVSGRAPESIIKPRSTKSSGYDGPDTIHYFECVWLRLEVPDGRSPVAAEAGAARPRVHRAEGLRRYLQA